MTVTGSSLAPELCRTQRDNHCDTEKRKIQSQMSLGVSRLQKVFLPAKHSPWLSAWLAHEVLLALFCSVFPSNRMSYILGWPMERIPWLCWSQGQLSCHFRPTNHAQIVAGTLHRKNSNLPMNVGVSPSAVFFNSF